MLYLSHEVCHRLANQIHGHLRVMLEYNFFLIMLIINIFVGYIVP